jgi:hypothetical protein
VNLPRRLPALKESNIRRWAKQNKVELCFTPTYASWANPIEAHFGPLRQLGTLDAAPRADPRQVLVLGLGPFAPPAVHHRRAARTQGAGDGTDEGLGGDAHFLNLTIKTVSRPKDTSGFLTLPRRWVVERTLAC